MRVLPETGPHGVGSLNFYSETAAQLASIEALTLRALEGLHDDRAVAFALAIAGVAWQGAGTASTVIVQGDPLADYDGSAW